jgi:hypothetical protein
MKPTINTIKRKLGRPTKLESAANQYARSIRTKKTKALHVSLAFSADTQDYNAVAPFLTALRSRSRGILSVFLREAVVKAVKDVTRKS